MLDYIYFYIFYYYDFLIDKFFPVRNVKLLIRKEKKNSYILLLLINIIIILNYIKFNIIKIITKLINRFIIYNYSNKVINIKFKDKLYLFKCNNNLFYDKILKITNNNKNKFNKIIISKIELKLKNNKFINIKNLLKKYDQYFNKLKYIFFFEDIDLKNIESIKISYFEGTIKNKIINIDNSVLYKTFNEICPI
jgi:hypothetical protein